MCMVSLMWSLLLPSVALQAVCNISEGLFTHHLIGPGIGDGLCNWSLNTQPVLGKWKSIIVNFFVHCFASYFGFDCLPSMSCDSCTCDITCSPYQATSSVQINLLQHPKVAWYKTHSIHAYSLLTHWTCVKLFKDFQSLSRIAHCNWNSGVSHAICLWNSHEALSFHPVITCMIAVCSVELETWNNCTHSSELCAHMWVSLNQDVYQWGCLI